VNGTVSVPVDNGEDEANKRRKLLQEALELDRDDDDEESESGSQSENENGEDKGMDEPKGKQRTRRARGA